MSREVIRVFLILTAISCVAYKPRQFFREYRTVDRIYSAAKAAANRVRGLAFLEKIVDGQPIEVDDESVGSLGIAPTDLDSPALQSAALREYALNALGKLGGSEVVAYLSGKTKTSIAAGSAEELWPALQAALYAARLSLIEDPRAAENFLDDALRGSPGAVASWAVNETCDRGLVGSLPLVRESVKKRDHSPRSEMTIKFCEEKVRVLSRDGNRRQALEMELANSETDSSPDLIRWVIGKLAEEGSASAERAIDGFVASVLSCPRDSAKWQEYSGIVQEGEELKLARVK